MSKLISDLLNAKEPLFTQSIAQLERISGNQSVDVRLTAEIIGQVQLKTKELGLDPKDTDGKELYHALINRVHQDDEHLAKQIGGHDASDVRSMMPLIERAIHQVDIPKSCWVLKKSVAKEFIKRMPPTHIMDMLNYKSVDSMLKNENILEIYGALRFAENPDWLNRFNMQYEDLKPSDFESRPIEIIVMPDRWSDIAEPFVHKKRHNITHLKELGVILMLPINIEKLPGLTITVLPLLLHYVNEIRLYSSYFKLQQVKPKFAKIFVDTLNADPSNAAVISGHNIHWRVIQRYFGKLKHEKHPEIFEPHVQPEDLHWRKAEDILYEIDPRLGWWRDLDYVGVMGRDGPVSLSLMDVAVSYSNNAEFHDRSIYHFRESLWNELFMRYMGEQVLEQQILKQLDNDMIAPETIHSSLIGRY